MNYEEKYKELVTYINSRYEEFKKLETKEPHWPDKIHDFKLVVQFRNDIFEHACKIGIGAGIGDICRFIKEQNKEP